MGKQNANNAGDNEIAQKRFVSTGDGVSITSDKDKYEEAKRKMRERLKELKNGK